jgi:hypothetical protein
MAEPTMTFTLGIAIAVRYDLYVTNLPNNSSLFLPLPNIRYTEARPD